MRSIVHERMIIGKNVILSTSSIPSLKLTMLMTDMILITTMMTAEIRATSSSCSLER